MNIFFFNEHFFFHDLFDLRTDGPAEQGVLYLIRCQGYPVVPEDKKNLTKKKVSKETLVQDKASNET